MQGIEVTLKRNKQYVAENTEEYEVISGENNATTILVHFPEEYKDYSKRVDFKNVRNEKWSIGLYTPENETKDYGEDFDKLNFAFTLPTPVTIKGELQIQFIAYLADESETIVPFKLLKIIVEDSVMYVRKQGSDNPDLILKTYEYANMSLEIAREALDKTANSERAALESEASAKAAQESAENAQASASSAKNSATSANTRATNAEASAKAAQESAEYAEQVSDEANAKSNNAMTISNSANTKSDNAVAVANAANEKSTTTLDIVENLTVTSSEIDCTEHVSVEIETNSSTKRKNIHFNVPAPKQGKSYRNRGPWDSTTQYINDEYYIDTVSMHGCTYWCKQTNTNQQPLPSEENNYWGLVALKGNDAGVTIVDNLESDNAAYVLSAKQGKVLKQLIDSSVQEAINNLTTNFNAQFNTASNEREDLQEQINNMLNGTTKFTLVNASNINVE